MPVTGRVEVEAPSRDSLSAWLVNSLRHHSLPPAVCRGLSAPVRAPVTQGPAHRVGGQLRGAIFSLVDGRLKARASQRVPAAPCRSRTGGLWKRWLTCAQCHTDRQAPFLTFSALTLWSPNPHRKQTDKTKKIPPTAGLKRTPEMMLPSFHREHGGQGSYWAVSPTGV